MYETLYTDDNYVADTASIFKLYSEMTTYEPQRPSDVFRLREDDQDGTCPKAQSGIVGPVVPDYVPPARAELPEDFDSIFGGMTEALGEYNGSDEGKKAPAKNLDKKELDDTMDFV